jgi:transcriptional regulator with PAS, ATPase and Fis domain
MSNNNWIKGFSGAVTVCDKKGIIIAMNDKAIKTFIKYGGKKLIGAHVLDCHPEPAKSKLKALIKNETGNCYTIAKHGVKKLIYQSPWYKKGKYMGFVELSLEIPSSMPHFIRK